MAKMKDSGIEWIGEIPREWKAYKLKYLLAKNLQYGANDSGIEYADDLPRYVRITDILSDGRLREDGKLSLEENVAYDYLLEDGDILFARSGATVGKSFLYRKEYGRCAFAGYLIRAKIRNNISTRYIKHWITSAGYEKWKDSIFIQSTIQNIGADKYANLVISLPPSYEQQEKIADYLDDKVVEIDKVISDTKATIEEYKKYKQAVITETVFRGIHKKIQYKDSGYEWIGMIPVHWVMHPFKYIMHERNEKNFPVQTEERLSLSIDKGITLYAEKTTNLDRFKDDVSQYKLAHEGDLVFNSMNMIVGAIGYSRYFGCVSPVYYTFYDNEDDHVTSKYYEYVFLSKTMRKVLFSLGKGIMAIDRGDDKINTCRLKVSREDLRSMKLPMPPIEEQKEIVEYLIPKCDEIDSLIASKEALVAELEAYKKSVIYEYVTGKKEVL